MPTQGKEAPRATEVRSDFQPMNAILSARRCRKVRFTQALLPSLAALVFASHAHAAPVTDPFPARIAKGSVRIDLIPTATGLASPVLAIPAPGDASQRLFVVDQIGHIRVVQNNQLLPEPFLDVTGRLVELEKAFDERGLLGLAFHPGFQDPQSPGHRRLFTSTSEPAQGRADFPNPHAGGVPPNHHSVLAAWKVSAENPNRVDPASRVELMRIEQPQFNHNGGMLAFGPDGFLYIGMGDGGGANDIGPGHNPKTGNAQDPNVVLGKMLRIDVNGNNAANGRYGIPADNPFAKEGGVKEIFAIGLRNPWRFCFDGDTLLAADVGQNKIEFVHRVERGGNYGWRLKEGAFRFNPDGTIDSDLSGLPPGLPEPILQYDHDDGISITGGFVYRGKNVPALEGKYVFGDWRNPKSTKSGRLFHADLSTRVIEEFRIGKNDQEIGFLVKGFGFDHGGELFVLGSAGGPAGTTGVVMRIVAPPVP
jgi:glucose/arabinose dehydrogenase